MAVGGPLTGSSSSINSSASDDSALPSSARASRALMHSLSTNDVGEYKHSVITGGGTIRIIGDNVELVRVKIWQHRKTIFIIKQKRWHKSSLCNYKILNKGGRGDESRKISFCFLFNVYGT